MNDYNNADLQHIQDAKRLTDAFRRVREFVKEKNVTGQIHVSQVITDGFKFNIEKNNRVWLVCP